MADAHTEQLHIAHGTCLLPWVLLTVGC